MSLAFPYLIDTSFSLNPASGTATKRDEALWATFEWAPVTLTHHYELPT